MPTDALIRSYGAGDVRGVSYWVRHGQSDWNLARLTQGQAMAPRLTELGRAQAHAAAALIRADLAASGAVDVVRSSDLTRARETAEILATRLDAELVLDERLREQHLGRLEGRPHEETWAAAESHDWSDPDLPIAGGESPRQVRSRMAAAIDELDGVRVTVLVSHGDAIRAALAHLAGGGDERETPWVDVPNGAVARVVGRDVRWLGP